VGGPDDDDVVDDDRSGMQTDLAGDRIHRLIAFELEIDNAVFAEGRNGAAGGGAQGDHLVAGGDVDDPFFLSVSPVRQTTSREPPRRRLAPLAFIQAVHPPHLAGPGIQRDHCAPAAGRRIEDAVHHERRRLQVELGLRPHVVGLEAPRDFEALEVAGVDLVER
jgi:hypothetical protein